jgi:hypothetical protein
MLGCHFLNAPVLNVLFMGKSKPRTKTAVMQQLRAVYAAATRYTLPTGVHVDTLKLIGSASQGKMTATCRLKRRSWEPRACVPGAAARRDGPDIIRRLIERKQDTLRFLHDAAAPFTNNQAERDGRMMKVKMKISGGFRCQDGADDFATIRSFISTAKRAAKPDRVSWPAMTCPKSAPESWAVTI